MNSLNDLIAEFYRKQTEMAALMHLMEDQIKARDKQVSEISAKKAEEQKPAA